MERAGEPFIPAERNITLGGRPHTCQQSGNGGGRLGWELGVRPARSQRAPLGNSTCQMGFGNLPDGRSSRRIPTGVAVRLSRVQSPQAGEEEIAYTENVSAHGARLISRSEFHPGEEVRVTIVKNGTAILGSVVFCRILDNGRFCVGLNFQDQPVPWPLDCKWA